MEGMDLNQKYETLSRLVDSSPAAKEFAEVGMKLNPKKTLFSLISSLREGMLVHSFFDMPLLPTGPIPVLEGRPAPSAILFSIQFPVLSTVFIPADLIPFDDYPLPLLLLLRSRPEEGRSARSSYPVSDWTGMKLVFSLAWIGFILAQRVAHLPGTDGLGR